MIIYVQCNIKLNNFIKSIVLKYIICIEYNYYTNKFFIENMYYFI